MDKYSVRSCCRHDLVPYAVIDRVLIAEICEYFYKIYIVMLGVVCSAL